MDTILMAAARGARILTEKGHSAKYVWVTGWDHGELFRIHPDDEHLRFGPISSALREMAETGKEPYTLVGLLAKVVINHERDFPLIFADEWDQNVLFLLILSEALAAEGL